MSKLNLPALPQTKAQGMVRINVNDVWLTGPSLQAIRNACREVIQTGDGEGADIAGNGGNGTVRRRRGPAKGTKRAKNMTAGGTAGGGGTEGGGDQGGEGGGGGTATGKRGRQPKAMAVGAAHPNG